MVLPFQYAFGQNTPSEQFRFAQVGCGGKGFGDMKSTKKSGGKLVAIADVDKGRIKKVISENKVPSYTDYRVMLDKHDKDIDGVVISTPIILMLVLLLRQSSAVNMFTSKSLWYKNL